MDGAQSGMLSGRTRLGRYRNGNAGASEKRRRIAERLEQLVEHYAGCTQAERQLLALVARLYDDGEHGKTLTTRTRAINAARRLLGTIVKKPAPAPTLSKMRIEL
jgi:hypothetical protein